MYDTHIGDLPARADSEHLKHPKESSGLALECSERSIIKWFGDQLLEIGGLCVGFATQGTENAKGNGASAADKFDNKNSDIDKCGQGLNMIRLGPRNRTEIRTLGMILKKWDLAQSHFEYPKNLRCSTPLRSSGTESHHGRGAIYQQDDIHKSSLRGQPI